MATRSSACGTTQRSSSGTAGPRSSTSTRCVCVHVSYLCVHAYGLIELTLGHTHDLPAHVAHPPPALDRRPATRTYVQFLADYSARGLFTALAAKRTMLQQVHTHTCVCCTHIDGGSRFLSSLSHQPLPHTHTHHRQIMDEYMAMPDSANVAAQVRITPAQLRQTGNDALRKLHDRCVD